MKPECKDAQAFFAGQLSKEAASAFAAHVSGCAACSSLTAAGDRLAAEVRERAGRMLAPTTEASTQRLLRKAQERSAPPARRVWWVLAPAAVALGVAAAVVWRMSVPREPLPVLAVTPAGITVPLQVAEVETAEAEHTLLQIGPDLVGVGARSRLELIRHDRQSTRVKLVRGSVAAHVAHKSGGQSFVVESGGYTVTVVGTVFRVSGDGTHLEVQVAEGRVRVASARGATYEVSRGQALTLRGDAAETTDDSSPDFDELQRGQRADAGSAVEMPDAGELESEGPKVTGHSTPSLQADLERWQHSITFEGCPRVEREIRAALRRAPHSGEAWRQLADCLRLTGRDAEASRAYTQAIANGSTTTADESRLLLAELLLGRLADPAQAERVLLAFLARPHVPLLEGAARLKLARAMIALGRREEAKRELQRVTKRLPSSPPALEAMELLRTLSAQSPARP
jgi:ferric-dicitrate binding protein FerR (iron transport regulator)/thioredoxin-like negative regulator of GroEL